MITVKHPLIVIVVFTWIGFVCAISFMEAWLKFRAEGVTLPVGLSIGRIVFKALNRVEWVFALTVLFTLLFNKEMISLASLYFLPALTILLIQTIYLLPALNIRSEKYIQQVPVTASNLHKCFVAGEVVKVVSLILFGIFNFKST